MNTHADKSPQDKIQAIASDVNKKQSERPTASGLVNHRPEAAVQRKLQEALNSSPRLKKTQAIFKPIPTQANNTGLPDHLKSGIENLSGLSLNSVKVHYNSDKPARLQAKAFAQGSDIHLATGEEKHLPHEAWHIVQQAQGKVKPTMQMKGGVNVNDDQGLENEADVMGAKALSTIAPQMRKAQGEMTSISSSQNAVLQAKWNMINDGEQHVEYRQDVRFEERIWEVKLSKYKREDEEVAEDDVYRYQDNKGVSAWKTAEEWTAEGKSPPLGARFQEQRNQEEQTKNDAQDYAFESVKLAVGTPLTIKNAHRLLGELIQKIRMETQEDLDMIDAVVKEEFHKIADTSTAIVTSIKQKDMSDQQLSILRETFSPEEIIGFAKVAMNADQIEKMEAGLRYKRVYEHEQNIITIHRRARSEVDKASEILAIKYGLEIEIEEDDEAENQTIRAINFEHKDYDLGVLYFGDARFRKTHDPLQEGGSEIFTHKETKQEHVQDHNDHYTPRFITRAIRYEDAVAILKNELMPTKMGYDDPISGKEANDYGDDFAGGEKIDHDEKVMGQIRGYGRFLSATTSGQMATSTSRGSYDSPFGAVKIDLAQLPKKGFTEAHSEDAMEETFDIDDIGKVEYIPKHLKGETANIKAGRDAYRAREIVIDSPPVNAVTTLPRSRKEVGLAIIGITSSAKKENIMTALGEWAVHVSFIEVNANYKRTIGENEGRSAFIFFKGVPDIVKIQAHLTSARGKNKIDADAHIVEIPSSEQLSQHQNPMQIENQRVNQLLLKRNAPILQEIIDALTSAHKAKFSVRKRAFIYQVKLEVLALQKNLNLNARGDMGIESYKKLMADALKTSRMQRLAILEHLTLMETLAPELAKLRKSAFIYRQ